MSAIATANQAIGMALACQWAGMDVEASAPRGFKVRCPFGDVFHVDGGIEPAFRIYDRDAYCFACGQYYSPVSLLAEVWEMTRAQAAEQILSRAGVREPTYQDSWAEAHAPRAPQAGNLARALALYCERLAGPRAWRQLRHDEAIAAAMTHCLGLLPLVASDDARLWLAVAQPVMAGTLERGGRHDDEARDPRA